jgi:hypothetical protein
LSKWASSAGDGKWVLDKKRRKRNISVPNISMTTLKRKAFPSFPNLPIITCPWPPASLGADYFFIAGLWLPDLMPTGRERAEDIVHIVLDWRLVIFAFTPMR